MSVAAALHTPLTALKERLRAAVARRLNREVAGYELKVPHSMGRLYAHIRKGDVVLIEGKLRISQLIKYATQSLWSHSALYVGDELLRRGGRLRAAALANFGPLADRLVIEALTDEGVVAAPLAKYRRHNIRVCRPVGIDAADLDRVVDSVIADLGKQYDSRNLVDLTLTLLSPVKLGPLKTRTTQSCLGNCTDLQVICSGMIAKAFQRVGHPILPWIDVGHPPDDGVPDEDPDALPRTMRHYSQILPRDFDLSPNFQIVNFDVIQAANCADVLRTGAHRNKEGPASEPVSQPG